MMNRNIDLEEMRNLLMNKGLYLSGTGRLLSMRTAILAKEKGFDPLALRIYYDPPKLNSCGSHTIDGLGYSRQYKFYNNPPIDGINRIHNTIQSVLQQWLRDNHNIEVYVVPYLMHNNHKLSGGKGFYEVVVDKAVTTWSGFKDYEEALEKGLFEALKLIKYEQN